MLLILLRHGIAAEISELPPHADGSPALDAERPLTERGRRRLHRAARGLRRLRVRPGRVLHSGLVRARQSAELVASDLGLGTRTLVEVAALEPGAEPGELLKLLSGLRAAEVLCVGHAPNLDRILARICGRDERIVSALGKGGAACLELPDRNVAEGRLAWLLPPRVLRRLGK